MVVGAFGKGVQLNALTNNALTVERTFSIAPTTDLSTRGARCTDAKRGEPHALDAIIDEGTLTIGWGGARAPIWRIPDLMV